MLLCSWFPTLCRSRFPDKQSVSKESFDSTSAITPAGASPATVKFVADVPVSPFTVTEIGPVVAPAGTVVMIDVDVLLVTSAVTLL